MHTYSYISIHFSISLFIYFSIYLSFYLFVYLFIFLSSFLFTYISICLSIYLLVFLHIYQLTYLAMFIYISIFFSIYLSFYFPIYLLLYLFIHQYRPRIAPRQWQIETGRVGELKHPAEGSGKPSRHYPLYNQDPRSQKMPNINSGGRETWTSPRGTSCRWELSWGGAGFLTGWRVVAALRLGRGAWRGS